MVVLKIVSSNWVALNGSDTNGDGIGDVPYNITGSAGNQDNFPLIKCPISTSQEIPGYDLFFLLGFLPAIGMLLIKKVKKS